MHVCTDLCISLSLPVCLLHVCTDAGLSLFLSLSLSLSLSLPLLLSLLHAGISCRQMTHQTSKRYLSTTRKYPHLSLFRSLSLSFSFSLSLSLYLSLSLALSLSVPPCLGIRDKY